MNRVIPREKRRLTGFFLIFIRKVRTNKISFSIYVVVGSVTSIVILQTLIGRQFESTFTAVLSLLLFLLPTVVEESCRIKLPQTLEIIAVLFVFSANILGEICEFYTLLPFWDTLLHCLCGFIFAAFGFSLAELLNRNERFDFHLSPLFLAFVALCFAVTVGVAWEFFECTADLLFQTDMQKDTVITLISSAQMNPHGQAPVRIVGVEETLITAADGTVYAVAGYLDVGLYDTMKDLAIDVLGAVIFCVIGFFYTNHSVKGRLARQFIPRVEPLKKK